ncbi:proteophosphoglycan ppg4 protein [Rutstroemia sp. NJR-2017a BBW]|nr:proteophosphoglycan ppg4 protein [Rutstroemia sp. NJR-2017a BBW]
MSTGIPSQAPVSTAAADSITENRAGGSGTGVTASDLGIENTNISTAAGVNLSERQRVVVGSVLDLFAGRPSLKKLSLWSDTATFADPLTIAEGRKQYAAQWYGLQAAFSSIERLKHEVVSAGNPIEMNLSTKYTVKGIGKEQRIDSVVRIWTERENGEGSITKVEDRWNGEIPEGAIAKMLEIWLRMLMEGKERDLAELPANVLRQQAFRNLNSVVVPAFVSVPKNEEEDAKKGN